MLGVQTRVTKQLKEARDHWRVAKEESQTLQRQLAALTAQVCFSFSLYLFRLYLFSLYPFSLYNPAWAQV